MAIETPAEPMLANDRRSASRTAEIAESGTTTQALDVGLFITGGFYLPAEFHTDAITFQGSNASDGTFAAIHDSGGTAVAITAAAGPRWYQFPDAVMAHRFIKIVTGTAVAAD
ncbi:MAG: hypothetical protein ACYTBS_26710, partial [Planctomycetota bacterium]